MAAASLASRTRAIIAAPSTLLVGQAAPAVGPACAHWQKTTTNNLHETQSESLWAEGCDWDDSHSVGAHIGGFGSGNDCHQHKLFGAPLVGLVS